MPLTNAKTRDVESLLHPYTNLLRLRETGPLVIERGKGVRVYDDRGKDYIEGMAVLWCTALGWGEEALVDHDPDERSARDHGRELAVLGLQGERLVERTRGEPLRLARHSVVTGRDCSR